MASATALGAPSSDDFNRCVVPGGSWQFVDPLGGGSADIVGAGGDARLALTVPAGQSHNVWGTNPSVRVVQAADNGDFVYRVKFASAVAVKNQTQGIVVEQDAGNWVRFDVHHNGSGVRAFAATTVNGASTSRANKPIASGTPLWMEVSRQGSTWTQRYSFNGTSWATNISFTHAMTVASVGVFAANHDVSGAGTAAAHTAVVDFFENLADPIGSEDGGSPAGQGSVSTAVVGQGSVTRSPASGPYACGSTVGVTAVPASGWEFAGWSGDLSGSANPGSVVVDGPSASVTATFEPDGPGNVPPVISGVQVDAGETSATVTWSTDEPATSRVDYGLTAAYGGQSSSGALVTSHSRTLTGLAAGTTYHFRVTSADGEGAPSSTADATFTTDDDTPPPGGVTPASDDFNRCVIPGGPWSVVDPVGDGTVDIQGAGGPGAAIRLTVPAGTSHNPWTPTNRSLRIVQPAPNGDLDLVAKFAAAPTVKNQTQGILVEQNAGTWLRFDVFHDGSSLRAFAASVNGGSAATRINKTIGTASPIWVRVTRAGNTWTLNTSTNGSSWSKAGSFTFATSVASVGVFAANHDVSGAGTAAAHTAVVDFFENLADPIGSEDGGSPAGQGSVSTAVVGQGSVTRSPASGPYACGSTVGVTAVPASGWEFAGWSGDLSGSANPGSVVVDGPSASVTATFEPDGPGNVPPVISGVQVDAGETSATVTWSTDEPATSRVDYGLTAAYGGQSSSGALVTSHSRTLTGLAAGTTYHFRVTSADGEGAPSSTADATFTTDDDTPPPDPSGIDPDDFNTPNLKTGIWTFADPVGGGTVRIEGAGSGDARLRLAVPAGASHDTPQNSTVRVTQPAANTDLTLEAKFDSAVVARYQMQGILVHQGAGNWMRFELFHDGSSARVYAGTIANSVLTTRGNTAIAAGAPVWMRVVRQGNSWTQSHSYDGQNWTTDAVFSHTLTVSAVGVYGANHNASGAGSAPAHTAVVDYFRAAAGPFPSEDAGAPADTLPPLVHNVQTAPAQTSIGVTWATDESATGSVRYGLTPALELGTVPHAGSSTSHQVNLTGLQAGQTYHLRVVSTDSGGRQATSSTFTAATGGGTVPGAPVIDVWHGDSQSFGSPGRAQVFANVVGNVSDPDGITSLTYSLNGGPQQSLSRGPDDRRLAYPGDFNAEIPFTQLQTGANQVVLRATDGAGAVSTRTVTVNRTSGATWPMPLSVDWGSVSNLQQAAQVVDGKWQLTSAGPRPVEIEYDRLLAIGDLSWTDYEVTVPVTVHSVDTANGYPFPSNGPAVGLGLRWQGHTAVAAEQPRRGFFPVGAYSWYRWRPNGAERFEGTVEGEPIKTSSAQMSLGVPHLFKFRVTTQPNGHGLYQFRAWRASDPEPTGWNYQMEGTSDLASGSVLLIAHHADVTFGDLTVNPL
ncbi:MAG: DUF1349 domain-containing protein [Thermoleophilia bacterium]